MNKPASGNPYARSLDTSWKEGIATNVMLTVMDYYLVPFALFLGASTREIGFLVAIPHLFGSLSQLLSVWLIKRVKSRLRFLIAGSFIQGCLFIPMAALAFTSSSQIPVLIFLAAGFRTLSNLIGNAWGSLMSEYLDADKRGEYFGWRSQVVGIAGITGMILAGVMLYALKNVSSALGYFLLFLIIGACRFIATYYFTRMQDLPYHEGEENRFTFLQFIAQFKKSNFVKYVLYVAAITFSTQLAAPYFSVYMLREMEYSYLQYTLVHLVCVISGLLSFRMWGRHADHVGNARVLKTTGFLLPLVPLLWLLNRHVLYIVLIEALAGFLWSGFNLAAANFIFDAVSPPKRIRCLGYFNLINGIAIFAGASIGGIISSRLPDWFGSPLLTLFALSGLLRLFSNLLLMRNFREVRSGVKHASSPDLFFSVIGIRPMIGRNRERAVFSFLKKPNY